jgi:hypothetical protein
MPEEPEAGDVGRGVGAGGQRRILGAAVEQRHVADDGRELRGGKVSLLDRLRRDSDSDRLGQDQPVARAGVRVREGGPGDAADDAEAVLELGIDDRVAPDDRAAGLGGLVATAAEDARQHVEPDLVVGVAAHRERNLWLASHGVDVGERVRRGDRPEGLRFVDDGGDEVDGERQLPAGIRTHEGRVLEWTDIALDPGMLRRSDLAQDLDQVRGAQLTGSTATRHDRGQANLAHGTSRSFGPASSPEELAPRRGLLLFSLR